MPPKKKAKIASSRAPSTAPPLDTAARSANTPSSSEEAAKPVPEYDLVADPWTDEQETALLKGIVKWKPVGVHKHFRMIAISEYMKSQGYAPSHAEHTRIPGIWKKLGTLYNLPALDEREDSLIMDGSDDADSSREHYCPFELPQDEYGHLMFERRLAMEGSASPAASDRYRMESRRGSTVADTDEPRSSPAPQRGRKKRGRPARSTRTSKLHIEMEPPKKAAEEDEEGEEEAESENGEEYSTDDDKDDSDEDDDEEEEEDGDVDGEGGGSPTTRHTRAKTSRTRQKEKKGGTMGTRRGGRRR